MRTIENLIEKMQGTVPPPDGDPHHTMANLLPPPDDKTYIAPLLALTIWVERQGWRVNTSKEFPLPGIAGHEYCLGFTSHVMRMVWIRLTDSNKQLYALAHELGHTTHVQLLEPIFSNRLREAWADSVAFLLMSELVPQWENEVSPLYLHGCRVPPKMLRTMAPFIEATAQRVLRDIEPILKILDTAIVIPTPEL